MAQDFAFKWFATYFDDFEHSKDELGELDRKLGDGDFAVNLASALKLCKEALGDLPPDSTAAGVFSAVSGGFLHTGGTSGPLLGMWFREIAKACASHEEDLVSALSTGVRAGTSAVQRLGGAEAGDKTMVDAMLAAVDTFEQFSSQGADLSTVLEAVAKSAEKGAESTADMHANLGRASYVGDISVGLPDPGAKAIALFFNSGLKAVN